MVPTLLLSGITGLGKTVLLLVAGTFIGWAVITAIFIPRRNQRFPRDLNLFVTLTAVLFVLQMGAVWWVTGTQEVEEAHAEVTETTGEGSGTETSETETTETESTETESTETETGTETTETEPGQTETEPGETETSETTATETTRGRRGERGGRKAGLCLCGLRRLPCAGRRGLERRRRPEPRRLEPLLRQGGGARHGGPGRDALLQGPALRAADRRRRRLRLVCH